MKKNSWAPLLFLLIACLIPGCAPPAQDEDVTILTTFFPLYIAAQNIVGGIDGVGIDMLAPTTAGCLHDYQLTTQDRRKIEEADIILTNGLGLETFLEGMLADKIVVDASAGFEMIVSEEEGHDGHGHEHEEGNAHVWVAPEGAIWQAERIRDELKAADPARAKQYDANARNYIDGLLQMQRDMHAALKPYRGAKVVMQHDSFAYFAREFGIDVIAVLKREEETQLSAKDLAAAATTARNEGARAIFFDIGEDDSAAEALSRETGIPLYALNPATAGDPQSADAYIDAMLYNSTALQAALGNAFP